MQIDFSQIKSAYLGNTKLKELYFGPSLVWKEILKSKYPFALDVNDLSILDINSPNYDMNVAIPTYIKYKYYLGSIRGVNKEEEINHYFNDKPGKNLLKGTKDFTRVPGSDWDWTLESFTKEKELYNGNSVLSYTGSWFHVAQKNKAEASKTYTFSMMVKKDIPGNGSIFINMDGGTEVTSENYHEVHLTKEWSRVSATFTATVEGVVMPRMQLADNHKFYVSSMQLEEGNEAHPWNDGTSGSASEKKILEKIFTDRPKLIAKMNLTNYVKGISGNLDEHIEPYMTAIENNDKKVMEFLNSNYSALKVDTINIANYVKEFNYHPQRSNPLMGFAPYGRWGDHNEDINLIYFDMRWSEIQPTNEATYEWEKWEQVSQYHKWKEEGKHAVFRLILDEPSDKVHKDVPEWLAKIKGTGAPYSNSYGKGWAPDYNNAVLLNKLTVFVNKLVARYKNDPFISYIQLGVVGHWGEWHVNFGEGVKKLPNMPTLKKFVDMWVNKFPHAKVMMRRPFTPARDYKLGLFNDMIGDAQSTNDWIGWIKKGGVFDQTNEANVIVPMPDGWKVAPIGGEFTSSIPMSQMVTTDLEKSIKMISDSHTIFVGQKTPLITDDEDGYYAVMDSIGYKFYIKRVSIKGNELSIEIENKGISPIYHNWDMDLIIYDEIGDPSISKINTDITKLLPNEPKTIKVTVPNLTNKRVSIGIKDPMDELYKIKFSSEGAEETLNIL